MEIIFLGTGDAFSKQYYNSNILINFNNTNLLLDCGHTCPASIHAYGIALPTIQNIFISHCHADHIGGLEEVALRNRYIYQQKINLHIPQALEKNIWDHSLNGGLVEYTEEYHQIGLDHYFNVHAVENHFTIEGVKFEIIQTKHIKGMKSYGIYFNRIFYTDDTIFDLPLLERMSKRSDLIIHDCSFSESPVHTYYKELLTLPMEMRKKIYLIHYGDNTEKLRAYMYSQGFQCAEKHMSLKVEKQDNGNIKIIR